MDEGVTAPANNCRRCGGAVAWETLCGDQEERWLGVCRDCGWMVTFLPDDPNCTPRDPLRTFLLGRGIPARLDSPPWIRLFRMTFRLPWGINWRHCPLPCRACRAHVTFETCLYPRPYTVARCLLCLACGQTTVEYARPNASVHETPVTGDRWSPPDVAIARLREAIFRPFWLEKSGDDE
jgi:hypothetical protein